MKVDIIDWLRQDLDQWMNKLELYRTWSNYESLDQTKQSDAEWISQIATKMGGSLAEINYVDGTDVFKSIIIEIEEETLTLFMLGLE